LRDDAIPIFAYIVPYAGEIWTEVHALSIAEHVYTWQSRSFVFRDRFWIPSSSSRQDAGLAVKLSLDCKARTRLESIITEQNLAVSDFQPTLGQLEGPSLNLREAYDEGTDVE